MERKEHWKEDNINFAKRLACRFYKAYGGSHLEFDDVLAAAYFGLCDAASRYSKNTGASFKTFSFPRINGAMRDLARKSGRARRRPGSNSRAGLSDIAVETNEAEETVSFKNSDSLNSISEVMNQKVLLGEIEVHFVYSDQQSPEELVSIQSENALLRRLIEELPGVQRKVLQMYYWDDVAYNEICKRFKGMHKSTVSRFHTEALRQLRELFFLVDNSARVARGKLL